MTYCNQTESLVIFAHGKESGPWGAKIKHLADIAEVLGCNVLSPDYSDLADPDMRVQKLLSMQPLPHNKLILVGSSMGGYVSAIASATLKPDGLFLMAPAFYMPGYVVVKPVPSAQHMAVVFGWHDKIIPVENGIRFAKENGSDLYILNSGHKLDDVLVQVGILFRDFLCRVLAGTGPIAADKES